MILGVVQPYQTSSNPLAPELTRMIRYFVVRSEWFMLLTILEPQSSRVNKDHRVISRLFGVVQHCRISLTHSKTQQNRPAVELDMWFNSSDPVRITEI